MTARTLCGLALMIGLCLMPASAQRGEFVQTPWPKSALPTVGNYTVHMRVQSAGDDAYACCASIAATSVANREDALMTACRKSFGPAAVARKGSTTIDLRACHVDVAPADAAVRYRCTAPLSGRCLPRN